MVIGRFMSYYNNIYLEMKKKTIGSITLTKIDTIIHIAYQYKSSIYVYYSISFCIIISLTESR
jgi:hypothetical protein